MELWVQLEVDGTSIPKLFTKSQLNLSAAISHFDHFFDVIEADEAC